jgi:hypothetical protein
LKYVLENVCFGAGLLFQSGQYIQGGFGDAWIEIAEPIDHQLAPRRRILQRMIKAVLLGQKQFLVGGLVDEPTRWEIHSINGEVHH